MGQVTLDLDDDTLARVRWAAEAAGVSVSAYVVQLVRERTASAALARSLAVEVWYTW